jgi:hypothetical protein
MADGADHPDLVDLLIKAAIFVSFAVFAVAVWFIRVEREKRKDAERGTSKPPQKPTT